MSKWPYRDFLDALELRQLAAIDERRAELDREYQEQTWLRNRLVNRGISRAKLAARGNVSRETQAIHMNDNP